MSKKRIDIVLVEKGLVSSREKAKTLIKQGLVYIDEEVIKKSSMKIEEDIKILVKEDPNPFVSRGGLKLKKAIEVFDIDIKNNICMDVGASTGGFTDCMLQNGAKKVYSADVGYGQLSEKLRNDDRVIVLEKTNVRYVDNSIIPEKLDFVSIDVSFISLDKIIPAVVKLMNNNSKMVCLIKPQFEAGKSNVGKKGVVKNPKIHIEVIDYIINLVYNNNMNVLGIDYSPIKGPEGNIEYLLYISNSGNMNNYKWNEYIKELVKKAHSSI